MSQERFAGGANATDHDLVATNDAEITRVVLELNALCRNATLQFALSVGKLIVNRFYSGDLSKWRERSPGKGGASLRKLAKHPDLPMTPTSLYRSIAMYELSERLKVRQWRCLSTTHLRLVLPLPPPDQERLLHDAEAGKWTVRRLEEEVGRCRANDTEGSRRGGRKCQSVLTKVVHELERSNNALEHLLSDPPAEQEPSPESARLALDVVRRCASLHAQLEERVRRALPDVRGPLPPPPPSGPRALDDA